MKTKVVNLILIMIVLASTLVAITFLPDTVPVHFDIAGEVDRWGSKYELLILPAALALIWVFGERSINIFTEKFKDADDGKASSDAAANEKALNSTVTITYAVMAVANIFVIYNTFANLGDSTLPEIDAIKVIVLLMGLMFIGLGNFMPKTRINSAMGLRLPWTAYNDNTWRKSNLFAGIASMITGALIILFALIFEGMVAAVIMLGVVAVSSVTMSVYAYLVYKKEKQNELSEK